MPLRKAARVLAALAILFALYALVRGLPLQRWTVAGAKLVHAPGWPGILATFPSIHLLTLLLFPVIPLIAACGWLYGRGGAIIAPAAGAPAPATPRGLA